MVKNNNIKDSEMIKTFNCGVGFCLIVNKKNVKRVKGFFSKDFQPYEIGFISNSKKKFIVSGSLQW